MSYVPTQRHCNNRKILNTDFENICDCFVGKKLSIHFRDDKTISIVFPSKVLKFVNKINEKLKFL